MAHESVKLFRLITFEYQASAAVTAYLYTDLPGGVLTIRETIVLPAKSTRGVELVRLKGTTKGKIWKVRVVPAGRLYLFGSQVYVRKLGRTPSDWFWHPLPVIPTGDGYTDIKLPIVPTPDGYSDVKLPIEDTPDGYQQVKLPIENTPDGYSEVKIPMRSSPDEVAVVQLPMDE